MVRKHHVAGTIHGIVLCTVGLFTVFLTIAADRRPHTLLDIDEGTNVWGVRSIVTPDTMVDVLTRFPCESNNDGKTCNWILPSKQYHFKVIDITETLISRYAYYLKLNTVAAYLWILVFASLMFFLWSIMIPNHRNGHITFYLVMFVIDILSVTGMHKVGDANLSTIDETTLKPGRLWKEFDANNHPCEITVQNSTVCVVQDLPIRYFDDLMTDAEIVDRIPTQSLWILALCFFTDGYIFWEMIVIGVTCMMVNKGLREMEGLPTEGQTVELTSNEVTTEPEQAPLLA